RSRSSSARRRGRTTASPPGHRSHAGGPACRRSRASRRRRPSRRRSGRIARPREPPARAPLRRGGRLPRGGRNGRGRPLQRPRERRSLVAQAGDDRERRALARHLGGALELLGDQALGLAAVAFAEAHELRLVVAGAARLARVSRARFRAAGHDLQSHFTSEIGMERLPECYLLPRTLAPRSGTQPPARRRRRGRTAAPTWAVLRHNRRTGRFGPSLGEKHAMSRSALLVAAVVPFLAPPAALAHHSQVGIFDSSRTIEITGVIKSVSWRNPHGRIVLEVEENGQLVEWDAETASISILRNRGVEGAAIVVGERVTIAGAPPVRNRRELLARSVLLPSGYEFTFGSAEPYFPAGKAGRIVGRQTIQANV